MEEMTVYVHFASGSFATLIFKIPEGTSVRERLNLISKDVDAYYLNKQWFYI